MKDTDKTKSKPIPLEDRINSIIQVAGEVIEEIGTGAKEGNFKTGLVLGKTVNIGNYESMRVDVTAELCCDAAQANQAADILEKWTKARLLKHIKAIEKTHEAA